MGKQASLRRAGGGKLGPKKITREAVERAAYILGGSSAAAKALAASTPQSEFFQQGSTILVSHTKAI